MTSTTASPRPPLQRSRPAILAGVCAGVAQHLGVAAAWVRFTFIALTGVFGMGLIGYLTLWALLPPRADADPAPTPATSHRPPITAAGSAPAESPSPGERGTRRLTTDAPTHRVRFGLLALVLALTLPGIALITQAPAGLLAWGSAGVLALLGAGLAWGQFTSQVDGGPARSTYSWFAIGAGWLIACCAMIAVFARNHSAGEVVWGLFAAMVLLAVTTLILLPVLVHQWRTLNTERDARARAQERTEIAAHLHDSVLQTLALIRAKSHDGAAVTALARAQERELREWLYRSTPRSAGSLAGTLTQVAAEVEEGWQVPIDVVTVGEATCGGEAGGALVAAAREAMTNAARHGGRGVRVFAEFTPEAWEVFVRDRGSGFDTANIPADRRGVRDSIVGRLRRHGGIAQIRSGAEGTEVHLALTPPTPDRQEVGI